jgi:WD and tetratricopeptide repeat-containing protein 1
MNLIEILRNREINNLNNKVKNLQTYDSFIDRLELHTKLEGHEGCVNCLEFSSNGNLLLSGSDDTQVFLWDPYRNKPIANFATHHRGNIFSVKFLPKSNDKQIVTGAADQCLFSYDLNQPEEPLFKCRCHQSRIKRLAVAPELPFTFFSSSEDGCVHQYDLRESHSCHSNETNTKVRLLDLKNHQEYAEVKCIAINPRRPEQLAVGCNDVYVRIYDRRMISLRSSGTDSQPDNLPKGCVQYYAPGHLSSSGEKSHKYMTITFLAFSPDGTELLANYGGEQIYLFNMDKAKTPVYQNLPRLPPEPPSKPPKNEKVEEIKNSGNEFLENENYIQAIRAYTKALQLAPKNPILYLNRATALMRRKYLGDDYEALRDCHSALHLDPHYIKAHFRLARSLYEISQYTLSNDCLEELKRRFPSYENDQSVKMLQQDINHGLTNRAAPNRNSTIEKLSDDELVRF